MDPYFLTVAQHPVTVIVSVLVVILATFAALDLAGLVQGAPNQATARLWTASGSVALGSGLWAMHFVGMSAADYPFRAAYRPGMIAASWLVGVMAAGVILSASRQKVRWEWSIAACVVSGAGGTAMCYIGLDALMVTPATIFHVQWVTAAAAVAIIGSGLALPMLAHLRKQEGRARILNQSAVSVVLGLAMTGAQYLAMASTDFDDNAVGAAKAGLDVGELGGAVGFAAVAFLLLTLVTTQLHRRAAAVAKRLRGSLDEVQEELRFVTFNDPATGLPNRLVFQDRLAQATARCHRTGEFLAVLFVDLDGFKSLRHSIDDYTGDQVLRSVAGRLTAAARASDTVANVGGDQFLVLVDGLRSVEPAIQVAERIVGALNEPCVAGSNCFRISASIGITVHPSDGLAGALVANAYVAAAAARQDGGARYRFFEQRMNAEAHARTEWLDDLRQAVQREELELYYQPKVHAESGKIAGVEALLRWHHPRRGMVSPAVFIPLAEQFGLIQELGSWVILQACRQMRAWDDLGLRMRVAINLSVHQLRNADVAAEITAAVGAHGVDPSLFTCEITESGAMDNTKATKDVFESLQKAGIQLSIDDFGTGYSSLSYLRKLPVRQLKIDRSFVSDLGQSDDARVVVAAIIDLAHALRLEVVAEGVETTTQRDMLLGLGCDKFQGFLFARPMPAGEFTSLALDLTSRVERFRPSVFHSI